MFDFKESGIGTSLAWFMAAKYSFSNSMNPSFLALDKLSHFDQKTDD